MVEADGPRLADEDDLPKVRELVDRCFRFERGGAAARFPFCYDGTDPERHAVMRSDGRVVAHAAAIPQTFAIGDRDVEAVGISGVATDPRYRGEGNMSALLAFLLDQSDAPLVHLGGDRQRYGHFGFEPVGRERRYRITPRSFSASVAPVPVDRYDGSSSHLDRLRTLHGEERYGVRRSRRLSEQVYGRRGFETLLAANGDAYVTFGREAAEPLITEFGGSAAGVVGSIATVFERYGVDTLRVAAPPTHPLTGRLRAVSVDWQTRPLRLVRVESLPGLLSGFTDQIARRARRRDLSPTAVTLGIEGDPERATLSFDGTDATVEATDAAPTVERPRRELTALLFDGVDRSDGRPLLEATLPLSMYLWRSERV